MTANVNYTPEQTETMIEQYKAGVAIEAIALEIGKSVRSVVAKLSREGVYTSKAKAATEAKGATKADLIAKIAARFDVEVTDLASLEKATKGALEILAERLTLN